MVPAFGASAALIDEIFYNVLLSYLTVPQVAACRAQIDTHRGFARALLDALLEYNIEIDIAFEYYQETDDYPQEVRFSIINNKPLQDRDRQRLQKVFSIFRETQDLERRVELLYHGGILAEDSGKGLLGFIDFIGGVSSSYEFREFADRTEQEIRLISAAGRRFFKDRLLKELRGAPQHRERQDIVTAINAAA